MALIKFVRNYDDLSTDREPVKPTCNSCGHQPDGSPKFCPECGGKM
jgi:hypothetical protein